MNSQPDIPGLEQPTFDLHLGCDEFLYYHSFNSISTNESLHDLIKQLSSIIWNKILISYQSGI